MRPGSRQDVVLPLLIQLLPGQSLLVLSLSLSALLVLPVLLLLYLSLQLGLVHLAGLLPTGDRYTWVSLLCCTHQENTQNHLPSLVFLIL